MKQPKKLTRAQKETLSAHYLKANDWLMAEETEFYLKVVNKRDGRKKTLDKFRQEKRY